MAHPKLKINANSISHLLLAQDTPIRAYKIKMNPELWTACQQVSRRFIPPSGAKSVDAYRRQDLICFSKAVQDELQSGKLASRCIPEPA